MQSVSWPHAVADQGYDDRVTGCDVGWLSHRRTYSHVKGVQMSCDHARRGGRCRAVVADGASK
jgi:hypothetical protein